VSKNNVILNLRGGGASGKTTCFRKFLDMPHHAVVGPNEHTKAGNDEVKGYIIDGSSLGLKKRIFLMGSYEAVCGGTDKIKKQAEIAERAVNYFNFGYHVLFEGLLVSKLGPAGTVTKAIVGAADDRAWFLFLDTPVELCLDRMLKRRLDRGDTRIFNPDKSFYRDHRYTHKCKENLQLAGIENNAWVRHDNAYNEVCAMLKWSENHYG